MPESDFPVHLLDELSGLVAGRLGLHYPPERYPDLLRSMRPVLEEEHSGNTASALAEFLARPLTPELLDRLAACLTIGETYFFRDRTLFKALEETILPEIAARCDQHGGYFRAWSAGCCTGEEAYSLAITLRRLFPGLDDTSYFILGTDINTEFLRRAAAGRYRSWSFRNMSKELQDAYFTQVGEGEWELSAEIKRMVSFSRLNLAEDLYPSIFNATVGHDLILCRNVLMYLHPQTAMNVLKKFHACLNEGGWLALAPSEFLLIGDFGFETVRMAETTLYRKPKGRRHARPQTEASRNVQAILPPVGPGDKSAASESPVPPASAQKPERPDSPADDADLPRRASGLYLQGDYAEAARILERHLKTRRQDGRITPKEREAMSLLIRCLANSREYVKALAWCEQAVDSDRLNARTHYLRATVLHEMGRSGNAAEALGNAIYLDSGFAAAHFMAGNMALAAKKNSEALRHYRNVREILTLLPPTELVPEADGITAGEMLEMVDFIVSLTDREVELVRRR